MRNCFPWPSFPQQLDPPAARSLSLLFILQEWLASFDRISHLKAISPDPSLVAELEKLFLFSLTTPFPQKGGALDKICFYCDILVQASKVEARSPSMIVREIAEMLLLMKKQPPASPSLHSALGTLFQTLEQKFRSFFSALLPFLQEARTNENIFIYLLESKEKFNLYLGSRFIENMLLLFFPGGHAHLRAVIWEGFTRRGFTAFLAEKEALLEELEWDQPCHHPLP